MRDRLSETELHEVADRAERELERGAPLEAVAIALIGLLSLAADVVDQRMESGRGAALRVETVQGDHDPHSSN
jgi:hypothetical protein